MSFKRSLLITTTTLSMALSAVFASDVTSAELSTTHGETLHRNKEFQVWPPEASATTDSKVAFIGSRIGRFRADAFQRQDHLTQLSLVETTIANMESLAGIGQGCSNLVALNLRGIKHEDATPLALAIFLGQYAHSDLLRRITAGDTTLKFTAPSDASDDIRTKDESGKRASAGTQAFTYKDSYLQQLAQDILTLRGYQEQIAQAAALVMPTETRSDEEIAWDAIVSRRAPTQQVHDLKGAPSIAGDASSVLAARFTDSAVTLDEKFLPGAQQLRALVLSNSQASLTKGVKFGQDWVNLELLVLDLQGLSNPMELFASASDTVLLRIAQKSLTVYMAEEALNTSPSFSSDTGDSSKAIRQMARAVLTQRGVDLNTSVATTGAASPSGSVTNLAAAPASGGWKIWPFGGSSDTSATPPAAPAAPPAANPNATATEDDK